MNRKPTPLLILSVWLVIALTGVPLLGFLLRLCAGTFMAGWNFAASLF